MKLLYAATSPFARKVRIVAHELRVSDQIELVACSLSRLALNEDVQRHNPMSQVPTLILGDGTAVADSGVICEYLNARAGGALIPPYGPHRWAVLTAHAMGDGLLEAAQMLRYETSVRPAQFVWKEWVEGHRAKLHSGLDAIEMAARSFESRVDLATITFACALSYLDLRVPDLAWRHDHPRAAAWFTAFDARPSMLATRPQ
jgi:glutathione S-transferase